VLIGDAAHGMLPHQGQGANQTIEDAITLAELLPLQTKGLDAALAEYEALRRARTRVVQRSARATNAVLHLPDDAIEGRAAALARFPERFGWIHSFDAREAVRRRLAARNPSPNR
jgi:salicylate hydroxylase